MNEFNALFQSKTSLITVLKKESIKLFLKICQNFVKPSLLKEGYFTNNILHSTNYLPIDKIFVGHECESLLSTLTLNKQNEVRLNILSFYVTVAQEIIYRLPINSVN